MNWNMIVSLFSITIFFLFVVDFILKQSGEMQIISICIAIGVGFFIYIIGILTEIIQFKPMDMAILLFIVFWFGFLFLLHVFHII
ncbi:TPA: hypothetical protein IQC94_002900 [Listeria monocytogenes]|nr:hypothetical protein [Listeria monocytogenes]HAO6434654.1 hypothetical protein [Listeria monocytogenes]